jgi:hypothetical protein
MRVDSFRCSTHQPQMRCSYNLDERISDFPVPLLSPFFVSLECAGGAFRLMLTQVANDLNTSRVTICSTAVVSLRRHDGAVNSVPT